MDNRERLLKPETSAEEAELLRDLRQVARGHPGWAVLENLVHRHLVRAVNQVLENRTEHDYHQGVFDGMLAMRNLVTMAIADSISDPDKRLRALPSYIITRIEF